MYKNFINSISDNITRKFLIKVVFYLVTNTIRIVNE